MKEVDVRRQVPLNPVQEASVSRQSASEPHQQSEKKIPFLGFSKPDQKLMQCMQAGICELDGEVTDEFAGKTFSSIQPHHPIYRSVQQLIALEQQLSSSDAQSPFIIGQFVGYLYHYSIQNGQDLNPFGKSFTWPMPIIDTQIIGSLLWRILFRDRNFLINNIDNFFGRSIPKETLKLWVIDLLQKYSDLRRDEKNKVEADFRMICNGNLNHLARLSDLADRYFWSCFPHADPAEKHKFAIINQNTTLIAFNFLNRACEFVFSNKNKSISSENSLCLSFYPMLFDNNKALTLECVNFNAAQVLLDLICQIYRVADLNDPESWLRLVYSSDRIPMGDQEQAMVDNLLKPFQADLSQEDFIRILGEFGFKQDKLQEVNAKKGVFSSSRDEQTARYVYLLLKRKIQAKQSDPTNPCTPKDIGEFIFRACESLHMHTDVSDEMFAHLWQWFDEDGLLNISEDNFTLHAIKQAIVDKKQPFSVLSACISIGCWMHQSRSFTGRQNPPIFFIEKPFIMRLPVKPAESLRKINDYLKTKTCDVSSLKPILEIFKPDGQEPCHALLCTHLNIDQQGMIREINEMLDHPDPYIAQFAMHAAFTVPSWINPIQFISKIPTLWADMPASSGTLRILYNKFRDYYGIPPYAHTNPNAMIDWIVLFSQTSEQHLVDLATDLWMNNKQSLHVNTDLVVLSGYCRVNARNAGRFLLHLFHNRKPPLSRSELLDSVIRVIRSFQTHGNTFDLDTLYPAVESLMSDADPMVFKDERQRLSFQQTIPYYLEKATHPDIKSLTLKSLAYGHVKLADLKPEALQHPLLSTFLKYRSDNGGLDISDNETQILLELMKQDSNGSLCAWMEFLMWIFYERSSKFPEQALKNVNGYVKTNNCDFYLLKQIYNLFIPQEHNESHATICSEINLEELKLMQETMTLLEHADPMISYVGLQAGVSIPSWRNPILFLMQLPKLLKAPPTHLQALQTLYQRISKQYEIESSSEFDYLSLPAWIKLLAQTKEPDLIALARDIWYENKSTLPANLDLIIFEGLCLIDPRLAIRHLNEMYFVHGRPLEIHQALRAINMIMGAFQKRGHTVGLEEMHPFFDHILELEEAPFQTDRQRNVFCNMLLINIDELYNNFYDKEADSLLFNAILKGYIRSSDIEKKFYDRLQPLKSQFSTASKPHQARFQTLRIRIGFNLLKKDDKRCFEVLDQMLDETIQPRCVDEFHEFLIACNNKSCKENPFDSQLPKRYEKLRETAKPENQARAWELVVSYCTKITQSDLSNASEPFLIEMDRMLWMNASKLFSHNSIWYKILPEYLAAAPAKEKRLPRMISMTTSLIKEKKAHGIPLYQALASILDVNAPNKIPASILSFMESIPENLISPFEKAGSWETARIFISAFHENKINLKLLTERTWRICLGLAEENISASKDSSPVQMESSESEQKIKPKTTAQTILNLLKNNPIKTWKECFSVEQLPMIEMMINALVDHYIANEAHQAEAMPWIAALMTYHLENSKESLHVNLNDEEWIQFARTMIPHHHSTSMNQYLFTGRNTQADAAMQQLAKQEFESQLDQSQMEVCLSILAHYFPNDEDLWLKFWLKFKTAKKDNLAQTALNEFEKIPAGSSRVTAQCWIEAFTYLKDNNPNLIWPYIDKLPAVFDFEEMQDLKEKADLIIVECAAISLSPPVHPPGRSRKKGAQTTPAANPQKLNASPEKDKKRLKLLNKVKQMQNCIPVEIYLMILASLSPTSISAGLKDCLELSLRVLNPPPQIDAKKIKVNKEYCRQNFYHIIMGALAEKNPTFHEHARACLKNGQSLIKLNKTQLEEISVLIFSSSDEPLKDQMNELSNSAGPVDHTGFFETYQTYSRNLGNNPDKLKPLLHQALQNLHSIYSEYRSSLNAASGSENNEQKQFLQKQLMYGLATILDFNYEDRPVEYLEWIYAYLHSLEDDPKNIESLKKMIISKTFKIIENEVKNQKAVEPARNMIKRVIEWEVPRVYADFNANAKADENNIYDSNQFSLCLDILKDSQKLKLFNNPDEWIYTYLQLMYPFQQIPDDSVRLSIANKRKANIEVVNILLGYNMSVSLYASFNKFSEHIGSDTRIPVKDRIALFKRMADAASAHPRVVVNGQTLLQALDDLCFNIQNGKELAMHIKEDGNFNKYLQVLLHYEYKVCVDLLKQIHIDDSPLEWKAHYTLFSLEFLHNLTIYGAFKENYPEYLSNLNLLLDFVVDIEKQHLTDKIRTDLQFNVPKPIHLTTQFSSLIENRSFVKVPFKEEWEKEQKALLNNWLNGLMLLDEPENPIASEQACENVIACLFEIANTLVFSCESQEDAETFDKVCDWLNKHPLNDTQKFYLEILDFHFHTIVLKEDPKEFSRLYIKHCHTFCQHPLKGSQWDSVYLILINRILVLKEQPALPEYREAFLTFIRAGMSLAAASTPNTSARAKGTNALLKYLDQGVDSKLLISSDQECVDEFNLIKLWLEDNLVDQTPLKLDELIFFAPKTPVPELMDQVVRFMPGFGDWVKRNRRFDRGEEFGRIFWYFSPSDRNTLIDMWGEFLNAKVARLIYDSRTNSDKPYKGKDE